MSEYLSPDARRLDRMAKHEVWRVTRVIEMMNRGGPAAYAYGCFEDDRDRENILLGPEIFLGILPPMGVCNPKAGNLVPLEKWSNEFARLSDEQLREAKRIWRFPT